jgi:hypothetical protein
MEFEEAQSALVEDVVSYSFLAIGAVGLMLLPGVYLLKPWGFWGTIAVSVFTMFFDIWAFAAVQASAGAGVFPAGAMIGYLLFTRNDFSYDRADSTPERGS